MTIKMLFPWLKFSWNLIIVGPCNTFKKVTSPCAAFLSFEFKLYRSISFRAYSLPSAVFLYRETHPAEP